MKNYNKKYWSQRSKGYDKTNWVKNKELIANFLDLLPEKNIDKILEIGIGTGAVAEIVAKNIGPLIGIDISDKMISKISNPKITALVGDAHNLEFKDKEFDLIYMRNVIHYIKDPKQVMSEVFRCLKPSGHFLFSQVIPPDDSVSKEYDWLIGREIHYPTKIEIIDFMNSLKIVKKINYILKSQSINNWINNTCNSDDEKTNIINRHYKTSDNYKKMVNYFVESDDIYVDVKHLMILAKK